MAQQTEVAVLGAGLMGCCAALALAERGCRVTLFERRTEALTEASCHGEGKLHLGFVYAADASFRTAALMQRGAASFLPTLSRWLPADKIAGLASEPFVYAVHRDTQVPVPAIAAHFARIAETWRGEPRWAASERLDEAELAARYDPAHVVAAFRTGEVAMDTPQVARLLGAAVAAAPRITLRTGVTVEAVRPRGGGHEVVGQDADGPLRDGPYGTVVNCLWANRTAVDAASGFAPPAPFLNRSKVGVTFRCPPAIAAALPSTTFVLGPFGDIVAWPDGRIYLSWYPVGMVGMRRDTRQLDWQAIRAAIDRPAIARATIAALAALCPAVATAAEAALDVPDVDGGTIFALGATDIDDRGSRLHQRHEVGLVASRGGYHSVDTGKYTLAPLLALEVAERIAPRRAAAAE
ncbi:NAD(P)/FAD-dependent oxidoreductase [Falsiroseomonas oryzae]|uniref:NAD(P)/FAD-dependent oxidoreductase n=1 Tax=Falsiroseomonas oryzae TaxID=2766473 RepID=UPI0022EA6B80|nr:FAD-dependent oxidoreductase [Roseomonas sp. MO-31]